MQIASFSGRLSCLYLFPRETILKALVETKETKGGLSGSPLSAVVQMTSALLNKKYAVGNAMKKQVGPSLKIVKVAASLPFHSCRPRAEFPRHTQHLVETSQVDEQGPLEELSAPVSERRAKCSKSVPPVFCLGVDL